MPIKRFYPKKDTSITNAVVLSENSDAKNSNTGQSDSLEIFRVSSSASPDNYEESKILLKFDATEISSSAANLDYPLADTKFYLRLFNVKHDKTTPSAYNVEVRDIESDFDEGYGLDMETYKDTGAANWLSSSVDTLWTSPGGGATTSLGTVYFEEGTEDLLIDITSHVANSWCADPIVGSAGIMINFPSSYQEHYTKKFFARSTNFHFKKPCVEARWESVIQDNGGNLFKKNNRLSTADNTQTLYFYNWVGTELKQINEPAIYFKVFNDNTFDGGVSLTVQNPSTGVYKIDLDPSYLQGDYLYYSWQRTDSERYIADTIELKDREFSNDYVVPEYNIAINNLKDKYSQNETANIRLSIRKRDKDLNIYTKAQESFENDIIEKIYYKITRRADDFEAIPYGDGKDGSPEYTKLSFDAAGNYFDLDMSLLEKDFMYEISFIYKIKNQHVEYRNAFKFRVE